MNLPTTKQNFSLMEPPKIRGLEEGVESEDLIIPRAKLLQALSPEVQEEGLKQGIIINSLTKEELPNVFVPIFKFTNWIRFNPRDKNSDSFDPEFEPGAIIWRSNDPYDSRVQEEGKFGPNGERPLATKFLNFFSLFPEADSMPIVISFSNTSFKTGKQLLSLCRFSGGDIFTRKYNLASKKVQNEMGAFYVLTVSPIGLATEEETAKAESWFNQFGGRTEDIKIHEEDKPEESIPF